MPNRPEPIKRAYKPESSYQAFSRPRDLSWFYNARRWRKVAKHFKELNPFCYTCQAEGRIGAPQVTDHIKGLGFLLDNKLDPYAHKELQNQCHRCHNKKSGREAHKNKIK